MFDKTRSGPCTAVIAGEHYFLVDTGPGTQRALEAARLPRNRLSGVLLTHFHSDHIGDLGEVMTMSWIGGGDKRKEGGDGRLPVYGGPGVKNLTDGFNEAYVHDRKYRTEHHGAEYLPPTTSGVMPVEFAVPEAEGDALWEQELEVPLLPAPRMNWKEGASAPSPEVVKVTAFHVQHDPCKPAYGYKFEYKGRTVVISGDTGHCPSIVKQSAGVDLLVHEACACHQVERMIDLQEAAGNTKNVKLLTDLSQPDTHTSPEIVMDIAKEANVKHLAYTHIVPPMRNLVHPPSPPIMYTPLLLLPFSLPLSFSLILHKSLLSLLLLLPSP
jgi:ribonuclease Z